MMNELMREWWLLDASLVEARMREYHALSVKVAGGEMASRFSKPARVNPTRRLGSIAVISATGVLAPEPGVMRRLGLDDQATLGEIGEAIDDAASDDAVKGILLLVSSPGGTVAGNFEVADQVWEARLSKPVHAFISGMGLSGGYSLASQAQRLTMGEAGLAGSIGVLYTLVDTSEMDKRIGIKVHAVTTGKFKAIGEGEITEEQLKHVQGLADAQFEVFVGKVARGRGMKAEEITALEAGIFAGRQAVDRGLVDGIGTFRDAVATLVSAIDRNSAGA